MAPNSPSPTASDQSGESHQAFVSILSWQGILPRPHDLRAFGEIDSSFPERIFAHAEREQSHRHEVESRRLDAEVRSLNLYATFRMRGQLIAAILTLVGMVVGTWIVLTGHPQTGGIIFGITVAAILSGFLADKIIMRSQSGEAETDVD